MFSKKNVLKVETEVKNDVKSLMKGDTTPIRKSYLKA